MNLDLSKEQTSGYTPRTYIAFVLDKSGSMENIKQVAINGFNNQLVSIAREANNNTFVSLVTFSTSVTPIFFNRRINEVEKLNNFNYQPSGWTALYDAVGYTVTRLEMEAEYNPNTAFLVVIISDGEENRSVDYTSSRLANVIKTKQMTGRWTFAYVGANQDLSKVCETLHIPSGNRIRYDSNWVGTNAAFATISNSTSDYLRSREAGITSTVNYSNAGGSTTGPAPSNDVSKTDS